LIIASVTHLWNPLGFPGIHYDEGIYMRRSMHVLEGHGTLDPLSQFDHSQESTSTYDHPFFGQLFMASVLATLNYPHAFVSDSAFDSIQNLYLGPRLIMGVLAIFDTFLVYKIVDLRYNRHMAFISSTLFASMPLTWLLNRIVLDSIQLPFLLLSVLFAIYCSKLPCGGHGDAAKLTLLALVSGIFLGIGIFTKLSGVVMVPLVLFLILNEFHYNRVEKLRLLGIWFIPVLLIPMIWPAYSLTTGQFDEWLSGLSWQGTERENRGLIFAFNVLWNIDPLLFTLGTAGIIFACVKRDFFTVLWFIPFLALVYSVGWVTHFHWVLSFPAFCIAAGFLILNLPNAINIRAKYTKMTNPAFRQTLIFSSFFVIVVFGLTSTFTMKNADVSSHQFKAAAFILDKVKTVPAKDSNESCKADKCNVTIISSPMYSWLFMYPLNQMYVLSWFRDSSQPIQAHVLLAVDQFYKGWIKRESGEDQRQIQLINSIYNQTSVTKQFEGPKITYDRHAYPFTGLGEGRIGAGDVEVRTNY
jgi:Dolichyl-phosphate-mannose-protein mannosyltransferase